MSETTDNSLGFPLKGTLRRSPFPKLVRQLARSKSTGSLYLLSGKTKKVVFFERGEPISVRSNVTAECLGQILAREGLITQAQCDQTLESIRRTGKKQGELLIEMGILSEGNLRYGLEAQLRHKLFDIFSWEDGRYQYKPEIKGDDHGLRFNTDALGLILTALLETAEESRARAALEPYADRFPVIDAHNNLRIEITPEEQYFLASLDGSSNIAELLELPADPPVPSAALLLYAAIQAGVAKLAKSRRQPRERPRKPEDGRIKPDRELEPRYTPRLTVTTYEDTPLPGELPKAPDVELEDDFGEGDNDDEPEIQLPPAAHREVDSQLVAAERDTPDETFEEDLDLSDEPALDDGLRAAALVADPAESGVFARVLDDDDDDSLPPLTDDDETEHAMPAIIESEPEPAPIDSSMDGPPPDPTLELEEIEEIEELDDLDDLDDLGDEPELPTSESPARLDESPARGRLDESPAPARLDESPAPVRLESARPTEIPTDVTPDTGVPVAAASAANLAVLAADLEVDDDLALDGSLDDALDVLDQELPLDEASLDAPVDSMTADELVGLEDLDDIDLPLEAEEAAAVADSAADSDFDIDETGEADSATMGALHFTDGETALAERRFGEAITYFEAAYEHGLDVAEVHALLAWARFQASGESATMADHALELLAYAEEMNPHLAMVHAYRSAVLLSLGDSAGAQDAAQAALDIDPYDELAIDVMDKLV